MYSASTLQLTVSKDTGKVKVTSPQGQSLSKVYVKCFSKTTSGQVIFFRDGYTDIRGTFSYFDPKNIEGRGISQFALFVADAKFGCLTSIIEAPVNWPAKQEKVQLVSKVMAMKQKKMMKERYTKFSKGAYECEEDID